MAIQESTSIAEVKETIVMFRQLNADEKVREEAYNREKQLHDEASAINSAKREGEAIGYAKGEAAGFSKGKTKTQNTIIENMRKNGFSEEQIRIALGENYNN